MATIEKLIKRKRKELRYTQRDVANKLHVHTQLISNFERGECNLSPRHMKKIIKLFDLNRAQVISAYVNQYRRKLEKSL